MTRNRLPHETYAANKIYCVIKSTGGNFTIIDYQEEAGGVVNESANKFPTKFQTIQQS